MAHETPKLQALKRERLGTKYARRLRREGRLPAVVYGHQQDPDHIALEAEQFLHHLHEGIHLLEVQTDGASQTCLIKDVQYDHLGSQIIHVDLTRIDLHEEVTVTVPLALRGRDRSPGARATNAILEQPLVDLEVKCLANAIPDEVTVDISQMQVDDVILVKDLKLPEGVKTTHLPDEVVVSVHLTREIEEAEEAVAVEGEPEVISERKPKEGEEAEEAKKEGKKD